MSGDRPPWSRPQWSSVLLTVTGGGAYLGAAVVARHRAQAAADLAALAAAARTARRARDSVCAGQCGGPRDAGRATADCVVDDLDVVVTVEASLAVGRWGNARAAARAGPA